MTLKMHWQRPAAAAFLSTLVCTTGAIPKITRTDRYLYSEDGTRFFIKGIAYQQQGQIIPGPDNPLNQPSTFVDQLVDSAGCARDLPQLQKLGVNAIRVYSVNSSLNHDGCMNAFSEAGIYVIVDLSLLLNGSINATQPMWTTNLLDQYIRTISTSPKYDNVLAYNIGNEVLHPDATGAASFLKAAVRDVRAYLTSISSPALVGYASIDGASSFRHPVAQYLSCLSENTSVDIFGLNNYEWCGDDSPTTYDRLIAEFQGYGVVAYFSEFGSKNCNPGVRPWTEVGTPFAFPLSTIWSGGLAFSYFSAISNGAQFGMATLSPDNTSVTTNADFDNLAAQYGKVDMGCLNYPPQRKWQGSNGMSGCPGQGRSFEGNQTLPPTPDDKVCACVASKLGCSFKMPSNGDYTAVVGTLTGVVCELLPNVMGNCSDISANGARGVYGSMAMCDPVTRLSYAFSQYYELNARNADSCDFGGNATINKNSIDSPAEAINQCLTSPGAVFTPSTPSGVLAPCASSGTSGSGLGGSVLEYQAAFHNDSHHCKE
ncbi:Glucanosyltransferase-domain-containing protein [Mycena capillaripes]|nr:Glucanosyltransferase-domain-containing protein [Mycena capillaripes]